MNELTLNDLIKAVREYNPDGLDLVEKAYHYAERLHDGQIRQSGEPYIIHPLNVAYILSEMHADTDTLCAGLLHDTLEDTNITKEDIAHDFNQSIANLVDGVTKISKMNYSSKDELNLANTRKIITGITTDVRIIIIKLADRLHNMRTLEYKSEFKQKENAMETMQIFVPFAYYLGAYRIKGELEDLSLKYLYPNEYKRISDIKQKIETESKYALDEMVFTIDNMLKERSILNEIKVRTKNIYGIYKKLEEGNKIYKIHDLLALKIMVESIDDCYLTLGIIHQIYHPINDMFKDYICNPKTNKYKSLHTTVFGPDDRIVQAQMRTFDMDKVATHGLTAYWDIKGENARIAMQEDLKNNYQFFKSLKEINRVFNDNKEFVQQVKKELFSDKIYVYTPKGEVIELPKGASVIDFAYKIHTEIGNTMTGAYVNGVNVPVDYQLNNKDRVIIITDVMSYGPRNEWLDSVQTTKARRMIREITKNN